MLDFFRVIPQKRTVKIKRGKGVIYYNPGVWGKVVFYIADYLLIFIAVYLVYLYIPLGMALLNYRINLSKVATPNPTLEASRLPQVIENREFSVNIPKISAQAQVSNQVDPFNSEAYLEVLKQGKVAWAKSSYYPGGGLGKTVYLFAHSTEQGLSMVRVNSVFYLLGELAIGDDIWIDYQGKRFMYRVYDKKVVKASEISYLDYSDPTKEVLILQTCWPLGTDWNRLLIFGELVPVDGI